MIPSSILYLGLVIAFTGFSQTLLKVGANQACYNKFSAAYINPYTFTAYSLYLLATFFTVYALKDIPLKIFYTATSLKFVFILILSKLVLCEKIDHKKVIAVGLIVSGVIIFNM
jgi:multidrug transporter EmrE-like cation transporter